MGKAENVPITMGGRVIGRGDIDYETGMMEARLDPEFADIIFGEANLQLYEMSFSGRPGLPRAQMEEAQEDLQNYLTGGLVDPVKLEVTCQAVPTQIEGIAYGKHVYFRERHGHWRFGVGDSWKEAVHQDVTAEGPCPEFMSVESALKLTAALIDVFVKPE